MLTLKHVFVYLLSLLIWFPHQIGGSIIRSKNIDNNPNDSSSNSYCNRMNQGSRNELEIDFLQKYSIDILIILQFSQSNAQIYSTQVAFSKVRRQNSHSGMYEYDQNRFIKE